MFLFIFIESQVVEVLALRRDWDPKLMPRLVLVDKRLDA